MNNSKGFTLIELMITVAIVAILAAVAIPSYQENFRKGTRSECQSYLLDLANRQERFFSQNTSYGTASELGLSATAASPDGNCRINNFKLLPNGCKVGATSCRVYELTVEPIVADSNCTTMTYTSANVKSSTGDYATAGTPLKCWR